MADLVEESPDLELGDLVLLVGGQLNKTIGKLYGFSSDRFTIQPRDVTDRVIHIPFIDGLPDPDLGLTEIKILKKAAVPGFIALVDMRAGQSVETFGTDSDPTGVFKVLSVDEDADSAVLEDSAGGTNEIVFGFSGIPRELPYEVIRTRESPVSSAAKENTATADADADAEDDVANKDAAAAAVDAAEAGETVISDVPEAEAAPDAEADASDDEDFVIGKKIYLPAPEGEIREIGTADRIYQDSFQRSDLLAQLIRTLPLEDQRNPLKLQEVRRRVELYLFMRNDVVRYGVTGEPRGIKPTSLLTLAEIASASAPLARKVANITKVLYEEHTVEHISGDKLDPPPAELETGLRVEYINDILRRAETLEEVAQMDNGEATSIGMPKFHLDMEKYRQAIQMPYILRPGPSAVTADEEVFRIEVPNFETPVLNAREMYAGSLPQPPTTAIPYSIVRILRSRIAHFLTGESFRTVEPGEAPSYTNLLIFPRSTLRDMGPIRSGILAMDVSLGMTPPIMMRDLLESLGSVTEFPSAEGILNLGVDGNILGNVTIKDWLENQVLILTGPGDVGELLAPYGLSKAEWNMEQTAVLQKKVEQLIGALRITISTKNEENKATLANLRFEPQPLLAGELSARILARMEGEPILQKVMESFRNYMGDLALIDINWFSYMYIQFPDLLISVLGQQAVIVARERIRSIRDQYLSAQMNGYILQRALKTDGELPTEIKCHTPHEKGGHVTRLNQLRKAAHAADEPRDVTKSKAMINLLADYRGRTEDNWVWCKVCDNHLICAHELLLVQEYLRPKEQEVIHKELILKFSGGQFGGKFICRVCGQAISEMEFDTNLEFDDQGRPMMGRSVMVDKDAEELDELKELMSGPGQADEEISFGSAELNRIYKVMKTLSSLVGINPEEEDYRALLEVMSQYLTTLPSREAYAAATRGKKAQDYDIYYSIRYVSAAAAVLLINIQTHIPEYTIYYTSAYCKDGFFGYPLESEANVSGVQCLATVTAGINIDEAPWNLTTLQKQPNLLKRRDAIQPFIMNQITEFMRSPIAQAAIKKKREYRTKLFGTVGGAKRDQISTTFRPVPYILSEADAVADSIAAAAASPEKQAIAWIRSAHNITRTSAALNPDAVLSETTGCLHPITQPSEFWKAQALPALELRTSGIINGMSRVATTFTTERKVELKAEIDTNNFYKLFADLCYRGENKGLPHQLGLGLTCGLCGLNFQENPNLPAIVGADPTVSGSDGAGALKRKTHIESQGVIITEETFYDLLDTAHARARMPPLVKMSLPRADTSFQEFAAVASPPFDGWAAILAETQTALAEIGNAPTKIQIATAAQNLVAKIAENEEFIRGRLGADVFSAIDSISSRPPRECGEALRAYLLVPFQRWISGVQQSNFKILHSYELSAETMNDILVKGMGSLLQPLGTDVLVGLPLLKVKAFINDLTIACNEVFPKLRSILIPGGNLIVQYISRGFVTGYIRRFVDPHAIPESDEEIPSGSVNIKGLYQALALAIRRYSHGSRIPTEEEIRTRLEQRVEAEKQKFIGKLDRMSKDERRVALVNKGLGLGEWAVGGTKAIRQYDPERYEAERTERAQSGLVDYMDLGAANTEEGAGRAFDMFGYVTTDADAGGGYDHDQLGEDDY